jgi:hypothetical protein
MLNKQDIMTKKKTRYTKTSKQIDLNCIFFLDLEKKVINMFS